MSLGDIFSGAIDTARQAVAQSSSDIIQSTLSALSVRVKTNLGPAFTIGGQYHAPDNTPSGAVTSSPGLLDALGVKFGAQVLDPQGNVLYTYGDMPPTSPVAAAIAVGAVVGIAYVLYRGVRSFF